MYAYNISICKSNIKCYYKINGFKKKMIKYDVRGSYYKSNIKESNGKKYDCNGYYKVPTL